MEEHRNSDAPRMFVDCYGAGEDLNEVRHGCAAAADSCSGCGPASERRGAAGWAGSAASPVLQVARALLDSCCSRLDVEARLLRDRHRPRRTLAARAHAAGQRRLGAPACMRSQRSSPAQHRTHPLRPRQQWPPADAVERHSARPGRQLPWRRMPSGPHPACCTRQSHAAPQPATPEAAPPPPVSTTWTPCSRRCPARRCGRAPSGVTWPSTSMARGTTWTPACTATGCSSTRP